MKTFFSPSYLKNKHPETLEQYAKYRADGGNLQSGGAFVRQAQAVMAFDGTKYFTKISGEESEFYHGLSDQTFTENHRAELKRLTPKAIHHDLADVGHVVNIERPDLFKV